MEATKVRFSSDSTGYLSILEIETPVTDPPLLGRLGGLLFDLSVQSLGTSTSERDGLRRERLWLMDLDGAPLRPRRKFEIQVGVLTAITESAGESSARDGEPARRLRRGRESEAPRGHFSAASGIF